MVLEQKRNNSVGKGTTVSGNGKGEFNSLRGKKELVGQRSNGLRAPEGGQEQTRVRQGGFAKKKVLRVGDICTLKITALAPNNIGIDEYTLPYPVFVPISEASLNPEETSSVQAGASLLSGVGIGSQIKAKIVKIQESTYAVAQFLEEKLSNSKLTEALKKVPVKPGDILTVSFQKVKENAAIVELANDYRLIVPLTRNPNKNLENVKVIVTRVKLNYAFAKFQKEISKESLDITSALAERSEGPKGNGLDNKKAPFGEVGSKFTTTLEKSDLIAFTKGRSGLPFPEGKESGSKNSTGKFLVLNVNGSIVFLKLKKGISYIQNNNTETYTSKVRVRVKITSKSDNCSVGKILQFNPISTQKKSALVLKNIREMINHGMHLGEKAVKCNARMKNYIWPLLPSVPTRSPFPSGLPSFSPRSGAQGNSHSAVREGQGKDSKSMTFAKLTSGSIGNSNKPLVKKGRHVINLLKTRRCLNQALNKLTKYALKGRTFLFIGTKKPAAGLVARASFFTKNSFYVNTRWLGGMLTNWKTICKSISKIRPILKEKQKVVREILERRQAIKTRLIKKALLLKKKSKLILNKGRILLETLRKDKVTRLNQVKQLTTLRNNFINKGMLYIEKRQKLIQKRKELILQAQTLLLKEKGLELSLKHKAALNQLTIYAKKLREYKYLLILTSEIQNIKYPAFGSEGGAAAKQGVHKNPLLMSVSYGKLKEVLQNQLVPPFGQGENKTLSNQEDKLSNSWILPNPPKDILNKIVLTCLQFESNLTEKQKGKSSVNEGQKQANTSLNKDSNGNKVTEGQGETIISSSSLDSSTNAANKQFIVCSTLISKFSNFSSYIKSVIKTLIESIQILENQVKAYATQLTQIKNTLHVYLNLKQKYVAELQNLKAKFIQERSIIRIVKRKFKALDAQKKLLKFLPRLRYLPTPQTKISEIVQILLAKIVDPKLKYPIENIYDQKLSSPYGTAALAGSSKKLAAARKKKWQRLEKYFGGIANMTKLTKAQISRNVAIIIGQKEEMNAVRECQKLGIKMFTLVDTNCNPSLSDHIIPANDDSRSSIQYILTKIITRIRLAQKLRSRVAIYAKK